ncbi:lipopolysaccharide biosynthesis protein, partial [Clostridiisalibacter paucivorans]|uniref:lipopolysaccharide biosynthesis protein n=1 Tax=Clostridiisalibacter paucivorans TaxID=408753 RepID=UPI0005516E5D
MNKKKRVLTNSILYIISTLLIKGFGFLLLPIYTHYLSPADYGVINLINGFNGVATYIIAFSLYSAVIRFYTDYKSDQEKLKRLYSTVIFFILVSGVSFFSLSILLKDMVISVFFEGVKFYPIILIVMFTLTFVTMHTLHQSILQGMQQGRKLTLANLSFFFVQVSLNIVFLIVLDYGLSGIVIATFLVNIGYFFYMILDLMQNNLITFCIDLNILKEALRYSIPLMPHNLSTHIATFASRIFINFNGTLASVGLYGIAVQFSIIIDTVQVAVNKAFSPWFYEQMQSNRQNSKKEIVDFSKFLLLPYSIIYLLIGLFSQELIILMTEDKYILSWTVVPILTLAYSIKSIYYFYVNILFYHKNATNKLFVSTITGSLVDIALAYPPVLE